MAFPYGNPSPLGLSIDVNLVDKGMASYQLGSEYG
jgi:hypothetical protein